MDQPQPKSPRPRRLRRLALVTLGLGASLGAWALFFPVPLGWAARLGVARALPADGPLQLRLDTVTFRWRWGAPALALEVRNIDASAHGRPLLAIPRLVIEVPKSGLWRRQLAPSQITLTDPKLTLDQTPRGALALLAPPTASTALPPPPSTPPPPSLPDFSSLAVILPSPGESSKLLITGATIQVRTPAGDVLVPFGRSETILAQTKEGSLQLDLALPLISGAAPPQLTLRANLATRTGRTEFAATLPAFATADLPVLPGMPPLPLRATVAFNATGRFDLATRQLDDVTVMLDVGDGEFSPPDSSAKIPLEKIELRGRYDFRAQRLVLETGRVRSGSLAINVSEFEATLGAQISGRWQIEITGPRGADMLPLLPANVRSTLPLSPEAIGLLALTRITTRGSATLTRDLANVWSSRALQAEGRMELALGNEPLIATWSARQPDANDTITVDAALEPFVPARWPAVLLAGTPAAAIDLPLTLSAQATLSPTGQPRSGRAALVGAPGTLQPLQPGLPPLAVRRLEVRVASEQFDRAWRVPVARLELADGATAELVDAQLELSSGRLTARGEARAKGFSGEFAALFLAADTWAPLSAAGLAPRDVALENLRLRFEAKAAQVAAAAWQPTAFVATADVLLRVHAVPLALTANVTLPESAQQIEATVDVAEFRPAQLGLTLTGGLTTAAFDVPVSLHATARTSLKGDLTTAALQLRIGSGRVKTPLAFGDLDLPVKSLALDASFDPAQRRAEIKTLRLDAGGLRLNVSEVAATIAPPHVVTGHLHLEPFAIGTALRLWPASQQPDLRQQVLTTLRAGEFLGAQFDWNVTLTPAAKPSLQISRLQGTAHLSRIDARPPGVPGPVTLSGVKVTVDYPQASVALHELALPGATLPSVRADISGLDTAAPTASVTAKFAADLVAANRIWRFAPPDLVLGSVQGELTVVAPFSAATIDARLALDLTRATFPLPGYANAAPAALDFTLRLAHPLSADQPPTADFALSAPQWLGAPLHLAGRIALTARDYQPTLIAVTRYEHGRTQLQARFTQSTATHREISITGPYLDLVPLLRFGLAAAEKFAAAPPPPGHPSPTPTAPAPTLPISAPLTPATIGLDVRVDQIEFGPQQIARQLQLQTRLEDNRPVKLTLQATAGTGNLLSADLAGPADRQTLKLTIGDTAGWMRTLTAPWATTPPAPGPFGSIVTQLMKVPAIVAGGAVVAEAELRRAEPEWLRGRLRLTRATLVQPPRVLQLLALKTGKSLQKSPLIEEFSIAQITLSGTELHVANIVLSGSGLIDSLKIKSASYGLADDKLYVDGEYFSVGFEVKNTLAGPTVWLKDSNLFVRSIGTRNNSEFGFDAAPEPSPLPKSKKP